MTNIKDEKKQEAKPISIKVVASGIIPYGNGFIYVSDGGKWGLPGGRVELFEDMNLAAQREISEEIGAEAVVKHLVGIYVNKSDRGNHILNAVYYAEIAEGNPHIINPDEIAAIQPFSLSQVRELYKKGQIRSGVGSLLPLEDYLRGKKFPLDAIVCLIGQ